MGNLVEIMVLNGFVFSSSDCSIKTGLVWYCYGQGRSGDLLSVPNFWARY